MNKHTSIPHDHVESHSDEFSHCDGLGLILAGVLIGPFCPGQSEFCTLVRRTLAPCSYPSLLVCDSYHREAVQTICALDLSSASILTLLPLRETGRTLLLDRMSEPAGHMVHMSRSTLERASEAKIKLEKYYETLLQQAVERESRRTDFERSLQRTDLPHDAVPRLLQQFSKRESDYLKLRRVKLGVQDFQTIKVIGKGAFGEVRLVQKIDTGKIYAMKTMQKAEMVKNEQLAHIKAERDLLAESQSPWVVELYYSFQDAKYLYLIMEFLPGGDMMTLLIKLDIFPEDMARFYIAECILAIESIHQLGFIHRDIKPDNILIDRDGHIKLTDFGLSTGFHQSHDATYYEKLFESASSPASNRLETRPFSHLVGSLDLTLSRRDQIATWKQNRRALAYSTVGTPEYIAPEIFQHKGYGKEVEWWSLGAILFEMLCGYPPFCSDHQSETYHKILNWKESLIIPPDVNVGAEAENLIRR